MRLKDGALAISILALSACGGGGSMSGSGQIDYDSPTVIADLQASLSLMDPSITVSALGDGRIVLTNNSDSLTIEPGSATASTIIISGVLYDVSIDPSGAYTYSPSVNYSSTSSYIANTKSMLEDISIARDKLGLDPNRRLVDLTLGPPNSSAKAAPKTVTMTATGTATLSGQVDGWVASGKLSASQSFSIEHNLHDASLIEAHQAGWDGTGVNLTVLDNSDSGLIDAVITSKIDLTATLTDGEVTETVELDDTVESVIAIGHGTLVFGLASGLDWQASLEGAYGLNLDSDCSGANISQTSGDLTLQITTSVSTNYCGKIGGATGASAVFIDHANPTNLNIDWDNLIETKNATGVIEILNYSFGAKVNPTPLDFVDNHNVVIVHAAGNDSEPNNGRDVYGDGRGVDGSIDTFEIMETALLDSDFADNTIAVGALDANGEIAVYSTIAGTDYDGSSYAFLVDDGTFKIDFKTSAAIEGNFNMTKSDLTATADISGTVTEDLSITAEGTSFAAPRVSAKIAIASQKFPRLNAEQLVNLAKHTAIDIGEPGVDSVYGHGKINLSGMLSPIGQLR